MEVSHTHRITIGAETIVRVVFILTIVALLYYLRDIALVVIASVVIASSFEPIVQWFTDRRIPRTLAVLIIYAAAVLLFAGTFYFLLIPLFSELQVFIGALPKYIGSITTFPTAISDTTGLGSSVSDVISNLPVNDLVTRANNVIGALSQNAFSTASTVLGGALSFVLIFVLSFYLSVQAGGIANFIKTITPISNRRYVVSLWSRAEQKIGLWLQGQLLLGVIVGVLTYLGLMILGVKHALLLGFLAGIFELIPLFGPILAAIPAIAVSFVNGGITSSLFVTGFYLIVQQFESQLIYPLVVKKVVGVPPIISIIALVIGAKLAGFLGLLLAVPVATILMEFFNDLQHDRIAEEEKSKKSA